MRHSIMILVGACLLAATPVLAEKPVLDCSKASLTDAVASASGKDLVITFTGVCVSPLVIQTDGLTLEGVGEAVIDGGGHDAITIAGGSRVSLLNVEVRNGLNGIVADNGAHVSLTGLNVHGNAESGISVRTGSSATLTDVTTAANGLHGLEVRGGSAATVNGELHATANQVFGINVNAGSLTMVKATVSATGNAVGIQIGTNANAFLSDSNTAINVTSNLSTGLTVVSGSQLVSFGGAINANGNAGVGVSVNSKSGLDLDAGAILTSANNGDGLLVQTGSVMSVFNTPQFSGAPGFSTVDVRSNTRTGVRILTDARITLSNQARLNALQNGTIGLNADNGAGITLVNSTVTGNTAGDVVLTFGVRADLRTMIIGTYTCDATVLVRGTSGITCPH